MNNVVILFILALSVLSLGSATAQESNASESTANAQSELATEGKDNEIRVQFDLDGDTDNELSTDEKFDLVRKTIKEAVGTDFDKDVELKVQTMTDEEKERVVRAIEDGISFDIGDSDVPFGVLLIVIAALVLTLGMPIIIVLLVLWFGHKKRRQRLELINGFLDAGKDVPHEILTAYDVDGANSSLRRGIMLTAIGLGIVTAFNAMGDTDVGALGLIPLFIGIARLVYWYLVERKSA